MSKPMKGKKKRDREILEHARVIEEQAYLSERRKALYDIADKVCKEAQCLDERIKVLKGKASE